LAKKGAVEFRFAECLERARISTIPYWKAVLQNARLDTKSLIGLQIDSGASEIQESISDIWSEIPGCYERHLQRKYRNPLFPLDEREVTADMIHQAQLQDVEDGEHLQQEFTRILERINKLPGRISWNRMNKLREEIEEITTMSLAVWGVKGKKIYSQLQKLRRSLIAAGREGLSDNPEGLKRLREAERYYNKGKKGFENTFVAQMQRPNSPILSAEVLPSLLSEPPETIKLIYPLFGRKLEEQIKLGAIQAVKQAMHDGMPEQEGYEKLAALEILGTED